MKPAPQFRPSRSSVIFAHTRRMLDSTALCMRKFATLVAEQYMATLAPDLRQVPFRWGVTGDDLFKAEKHNAQQIARYMDGTVKALPTDLEDAWVAALPEPFRGECERDLGRRRGFLPIWLGSSNAMGACVAPIATEFGQLVEALAPALADGRITSDDLPHARRILDEADDLIAAVMGLRQQVQDLVANGNRRGGRKPSKPRAKPQPVRVPRRG